MRLAILIVPLLFLTLAVSPVGSAAPVYERTGHYRAGIGISYTLNACGFSGNGNNVASNCIAVPEGLEGYQARVRDEGQFAPATQKMRMCFYRELNWQIICPEASETCPEPGWAFCATIPSGTRLISVASATGVDVHWRLIVE